MLTKPTPSQHEGAIEAAQRLLRCLIASRTAGLASQPEMASNLLDSAHINLEAVCAALGRKLPESTPDGSHASKSVDPVNCSTRLRLQGQTYPRTCERCRLGPGPFFHEDGTAKGIEHVQA